MSEGSPAAVGGGFQPFAKGRVLAESLIPERFTG
jgi:hypothetical protein